jgi:hypothetical protein
MPARDPTAAVEAAFADAGTRGADTAVGDPAATGAGIRLDRAMIGEAGLDALFMEDILRLTDAGGASAGLGWGTIAL